MKKRPWLWINRAISNQLTRLLVRTPVTPNQITFASMGFGILAGIFLSLGTYKTGLWGILFFEIAYLLDNCDGDIARLKNMKSELGARLDILCDIVTDLAFFIGIFLGAYESGIPGPLNILFWVSLFGLAAHYGIVFLEKRKGFGPAEHGRPNPEGSERDSFISEILNAASEGEISLLVVLAGLTGVIYWLAWLIPVYMNAIWMVNLARNFRWL